MEILFGSCLSPPPPPIRLSDCYVTCHLLTERADVTICQCFVPVNVKWSTSGLLPCPVWCRTFIFCRTFYRLNDLNYSIGHSDEMRMREVTRCCTLKWVLLRGICFMNEQGVAAIRDSDEIHYIWLACFCHVIAATKMSSSSSSFP